MTPNEIQIMAGGGRCVIMTDTGKYLGFVRPGQIGFVDSKDRAFCYDYVKDNVRGQIEQVEQAHGIKWQAVPV